ncbi:hypothetical protein DFP72DRAFT_1084759 [Ephemerocybe angulata]|uniref:Uncharacterized protein n=1 Tax=Ephemerocybe angulata TaxID=980116 RepID=A0A8H6LU39_9AGAR|nr:hypothetical protein DFP72DRAFT_1084759 [Tulosesus angulatus]
MSLASSASPPSPSPLNPLLPKDLPDACQTSTPTPGCPSAVNGFKKVSRSQIETSQSTLPLPPNLPTASPPVVPPTAQYRLSVPNPRTRPLIRRIRRLRQLLLAHAFHPRPMRTTHMDTDQRALCHHDSTWQPSPTTLLYRLLPTTPETCWRRPFPYPIKPQRACRWPGSIIVRLSPTTAFRHSDDETRQGKQSEDRQSAGTSTNLDSPSTRAMMQHLLAAPDYFAARDPGREDNPPPYPLPVLLATHRHQLQPQARRPFRRIPRPDTHPRKAWFCSVNWTAAFPPPL